MSWNLFYRRCRYYLQYFPLTINFFIVAAAWAACWFLLKNNSSDEEQLNDLSTSFEPLILIMGKVALWFVGSLLALSLLSTLICWCHFLWLRQRKQHQLELSFDHESKKNALWFQAFLRDARRPILGFIKGRWFYDDYEMTDKFILASNQRQPGKFRREGVAAKSLLKLPDVKTYKIAGGFIYFEDMLQLIALPVRQQIKDRFFQAPQALGSSDTEVDPLKTDDAEQRIDQLRRVDGEYIHYKDFEPGDDVRRIAWKIYAKNRELVVRVPEIFNPYASKIGFFASFHTDSKADQRKSIFAKAMLNYYKNSVWTIYASIDKKSFDILFYPDRDLHIPEQENEQTFVQHAISSSEWHEEYTLEDYFKPDYGSILCISSMNDMEDIKRTLDKCSSNNLIYFVKISACFKHATPLSLFWRLILRPSDDQYKRIRGQWFFSPLRLRILRKEKTIEKMLLQSNARIANL